MAQKKALTDAERKTVITMRNAGVPYAVIAARFNVSSNTIIRVCKPELYARQLETNRKYNTANAAALDARKRATTKRFSFFLNLSRDKDIIEHLASQENLTGYLRDLIRKDLNSGT